MLKKLFKKLLLLLKHIRIVQRFFISYSVLILIVMSSWVFTYVTTKQLEQSFVELEVYEQSPIDPKLKQELVQLSQTYDDFNQFFEQEVNHRLQEKIAQQMNIIKERGNDITLYLVVVIGAIILSTALLLLFMRYNIILPVNTVTEAAKRFGRGELVQVPVEGRDEIGILSAAFNKMIQDITATHQALQQELEKTKAMDKQKSEFLSLAAHQLRTPLAGMRWLFTLSLAGDLGTVTPEQRHYWQEGLDNTDRMIRLVNRMLDVAEVEELKVQYTLQPLSITDLVNDVVKMLTLKAQKKNITIAVHAPPSRVPTIRLDREKMEIALQNVLDNAIKYSPEKSSIDIRVTPQEKTVRIIIEDHGYGIPTKEQPLVFTKFFRGSNILKIQTDVDAIGTGLGLFIAKDIITKHDGRIFFQSEENKGATFFIELPLETARYDDQGT